MTNKTRFLFFLKAVVLIIWASIAIGTSFAVWNAGAGEAPNTFIKCVAAANIVLSGIAIFCAAKLIKIKE